MFALRRRVPRYRWLYSCVSVGMLVLLPSAAAGQVPGWSVDAGAFGEQMIVTGQLHLQGTASTSSADMVAAFEDGKVRGVASPQTSGFVLMTIYGNTRGATLTFEAYDADADDDGEVVDLPQLLDFAPGCTQGSGMHPYTWTDAVPDGARWTFSSATSYDESMHVIAKMEASVAGVYEKVAAFVGGDLRGLAEDEGGLQNPFTMTVHDAASVADCPVVTFYA